MTTIIMLIIANWAALTIGGSIPLLGTSIAAILLGAIIRHTPLYSYFDSKIIKFVSKYFLKTGIVLLGFTLSLRILGQVGWEVLIILVSVVVISLLTSLILSKLLKVDFSLGLLLGIGTSICGGSAIAATAPILEAEDEEIAVSITTMFIYSMLALLVLPTLGRALSFSDQLYGILAGAAVNDTASVVAAAFAWSDEAGSIATIVKLVRTLLIVPMTVGLIYFKFAKQRKVTQSVNQPAVSWEQVKANIPLFVVFFVLAVAFASLVTIPTEVTSLISRSSKLFMTMALFVIGLGVHIDQIKKAGLKPIVLGAVTWTAVLVTSIGLLNILYR